jgi:hypothetical protein
MFGLKIKWDILKWSEFSAILGCQMSVIEFDLDHIYWVHKSCSNTHNHVRLLWNIFKWVKEANVQGMPVSSLP